MWNFQHFTGRVESKFERKQLSKILKKYQFSSSEINVKLVTVPAMDDAHKYDYYDPNSTLREDVVKTIGRMRADGYIVEVDLKIIMI